MKTLSVVSLCLTLSAPALGAAHDRYFINGTQYDITYGDPVETPLGTIAQETVTQHDDRGHVRQWTACELQTKQGWTETQCPESD